MFSIFEPKFVHSTAQNECSKAVNTPLSLSISLIRKYVSLFLYRIVTEVYARYLRYVVR